MLRKKSLPAFVARVGALLALAAGLTLSLPVVPAATADDPSIVGQWSSVIDVGIVAIHSHLLPDGRVLFFDSTGHRAKTWNPVTGASIAVPNTFVNVFCSGHTFLPDGKLFVGGGHVDNGVGPKTMCTFDYRTNTWTRLPDTNAGRWYPTCTSLANGDTLVSTGNIDNALGINRLLQVYQANGTVRNLENAYLYLPLYAFMHLGPDGRVFNSGPNQRTRYIDTRATGSYVNVADGLFGYRDFGTSVMYDSGKVLLVGGHDPPTETAEVIDLNVPGPEWRAVQPLPTPRRQINATLLADGKVLVTGGSRLGGFNNPAGAMLTGELWDPTTEQWSTTAAMQTARMYHSTALLLPDGRVLCGGGGEPANEEPPHPNVEIYSPPYLFKGARPTVSDCPTDVGFGQSFTLTTPNAASINRINLVRLGSVTHAYNQTQQFNPLAFTRGTGVLTVSAPAAGTVPPGHYLLFILNSGGVPSMGRIVSITSDPPSPAPIAPAGLTAVPLSTRSISLNWLDRSTNESGFKIERSTNGGPFTARGTVTANVVRFDDLGLQSGILYAYRVFAFNTRGASPASNIASARTLTFDPSGSGLVGDYYKETNYTKPALARVDQTIDFRWGAGAPAVGLNSDRFSVRWRGEIQPRFSETYTFRVISDEAARLSIGGAVIVDDLAGHSERAAEGSIVLEAGRRYSIELSFQEFSGAATCVLQWKSPSQPLEVVPSQHLYPNGLIATYFDTPTLSVRRLDQSEGPINHSWGTGSPASGVAAGTYSVRWKGALLPKRTETHTITVLCSGAVRLYVDGIRVINAWNERPQSELSATIPLTAGKKRALVMEYAETSGGGGIRLYWQSAGTSKHLIPRANLSPK